MAADTTLSVQKKRMARSLAILIMGTGLLLLAAVFWLRAPPPPENQHPVYTPVKAVAPPPAPAAAKHPPESAPPVKPVSVSSLRDVAPKTAEEENTLAQAQPTTPPPNSLEKTPAPTTSNADPQPESVPEQSIAPEENAPAPASATTEPTPENGWIYVGQFTDNHWLTQGLQIGDSLPIPGQRYTLAWGANVRATTPHKRTAEEEETKLSENIGYVPSGREVEILQIKRSGNQGHIWVQIKY